MEVKAGYKQTDVGVLPEDWSLMKLADLVQRGSNITYGVVQPGPNDANGVPFIRGGDIFSGEIDVKKLRRITKEISEKYKRTLLEGGEILISLVGYPGETALVPMSLEGANIARQVALVKLEKSTKIDPSFVCKFLQSSIGRQQLLNEAIGSAQKVINLRDIGKVVVSIPPLPEQQAIANALSDVDQLIATLDQLIAKKRDLKQAAMQQLLTGKTRLQGFSGDWETVKVSDVIDEYFCGPSPTCEERNVENSNEWGVLKTTAITKEFGWNWKAHKVLPKQYWNKHHIKLKIGDVLVTKAGPRHRVGVSTWIDYVPENIVPSGKMICLRPNSQLVVSMMLAASISENLAQTYMDQRTTGMAESQVNFENEVLLDAPINIPALIEQKAIAEVLMDMDSELAELEQRRDKTIVLKQGMMQELLTGRTRLV